VILKAGWNCWRIAAAHRVALLIDGASYFAALRAAIGRAQHQILILGWDVDSRVLLSPRPGPDGEAVDLLSCLNRALDRQPDLRVFMLGWDFSVIYAFERELLPEYRFAARAHPRLRFQLDSVHPVGGSHHQKVVVIDDRVAFAGGLDLAIRRWDDPRHLATNPDRRDPGGLAYPPVHDVQMAVDGDAARDLGDLARDRWLAATGEAIAPPPRPTSAPPADTARADTDGDPWPRDLAPDLTLAPIGISRTQTAVDDGGEDVREVLNLTVDAIAAARRSIYIESQYFTSIAIGRAIAARLQESDGPEIAVVLPREECGWLERSSMGIMRARLVERLRAVDRGGRLGLFYPTVPGLDGGCLNLHAKVLIVDDQLLRVGSANMSNRSMGLDTECDLVIEASGDPARQAAIAGFRDRLLAEHLGAAPEAVAAEIGRRGSLLAGIEALRAGERTLAPLPTNGAPAAAPVPDARGASKSRSRESGPVLNLAFNLAFLDGLVCDPERPAPDLLLDRFVAAEHRRPMHRSLLGWAAALLTVFAIAAAWRFTPLRQLLDIDKVVALGKDLRGHPAAPLLVLGGYLVGAVVLFPITPLLVATALVFGPLPGIAYSMVGALSGALLTYGIGRLVGSRRIGASWLAGPRTTRIREHLRRRGLVAVITARMLPVGNFSLINLIAGALPIRLRDFMIGNVIGLLPGVLGLALFTGQLGRTLRNPSPRDLLVLCGIVIAASALVGALRRRLARARRKPVERTEAAP